ncbi:MAG: MarR family transcriptional regulator [Bdellovibrionales bacterium]|nr:MarR family transcriptional regulator [Bdellovibrionales bacterium]
MDISLAKAREVHDHVLLFQRRMRRARFDYEFPLDKDAMLLLMLLSTEKKLTATEIAAALRLNKGKVSRQLFKLEEGGYIESSLSKLDRRSRLLAYTEKGRAMVEELRRINNDISVRGIHPISGEDRKLIRVFFEKLNDGLGFEPADANPGERKLWNQQRRIASASGMVGLEYMQSGLEIFEYQIFFELRRQAVPLRFSHFVECLPFEPTKMSRALTRFEKKSYVTKEVDESDKRSVVCALTAKGAAYFGEIDDRVAERYRHALARVPKKYYEGFIRLMKSLEGVPLPLPSAPPLSYAICESEQDYHLARKILVELLVEAKRHDALSPELVPSRYFAILFRSGSEPCGVLVLDPERNEICHFELRLPQSADAALLTGCFERGLALYQEKSGASNPSLPLALQDRLSLLSLS